MGKEEAEREMHKEGGVSRVGGRGVVRRVLI